jgi:hypothetical protein
MDLRQKKQAHLQLSDPTDSGDAWIWRAMALPSPLHVVNHLSHDRSEKEATAFLAAFKVRTDGRPPLFRGFPLPGRPARALRCQLCQLWHQLAVLGVVENRPECMGEGVAEFTPPRGWTQAFRAPHGWGCPQGTRTV